MAPARKSDGEPDWDALRAHPVELEPKAAEAKADKTIAELAKLPPGHDSVRGSTKQRSKVPPEQGKGRKKGPRE